jgi:hypothetical protein
MTTLLGIPSQLAAIMLFGLGLSSFDVYRPGANHWGMVHRKLPFSPVDIVAVLTSSWQMKPILTVLGTWRIDNEEVSGSMYVHLSRLWLGEQVHEGLARRLHFGTFVPTV